MVVSNSESGFSSDMKIAFFSKCLPSDQPNGVSVQVHRLSQELVRSGHKLTVFSYSPAPSDALYECKQVQMPDVPKLLKKLIPALYFKTVDISEFDVVHYHGDDYLCRGTEKRVRTFYGSALSEAIHAGKPGRFLYQLLFYIFEWISCLRKGRLTVISRSTFKTLPLVKTHIPCGVPLDIYRPQGIKTSFPSILFLGDLYSRKRGKLLIDVFTNEILPIFPDCILTIAGPQKCSGRNIVYAGRIKEEDLIREYQRSWIYCMPSSYEGFGVPIIEAMACGTVVIATKNKGSLEIIEHGKNGFCVKPKLLGRGIIELISDGNLRSRLVEEGLRRISEFDMKKISARYEAIYGM
jgi:phosphatidylinositol alpha-mannosyltransferase